MRKNISLKHLNGFKFPLLSAYFQEIYTLDDFFEVLEFSEKKNLPILNIGEGTNLFFRDNFEGIVLNSKISKLEKIEETSHEVFLDVGSGLNWHKFVNFCVEKKFSGLENLALIPGLVGAAPIQNIGAYGVEIKDFIYSVTFFDFASRTERTFSNQQCFFEYRSSIFKKKMLNEMTIISMIFKVSKKLRPNLSYPDLHHLTKEKKLTQKMIFENVCRIRKEKLPDHRKEGNVGSFFLNPIVSKKELEVIKYKIPDIRVFKIKNNVFKIPAASLIDFCRLKGVYHGGAQVNSKQPLVLVNADHATPQDVFELAQKITSKVREVFGIILIPEVQYV